MRRIDKDGTNEALVYNAIYYERSGSGPWDAQYFGAFTLDLANRDFYIRTYKGNSEERSIVRVTMDPESASNGGPGTGGEVSLYGHASIPHSQIAANIHFDYQGPSAFLPNSSFEVSPMKV